VTGVTNGEVNEAIGEAPASAAPDSDAPASEQVVGAEEPAIAELAEQQAEPAVESDTVQAS
jgi:hypothetical protein